MSLFKFSFNRYVLITVLLFSAQTYASGTVACFEFFKSPLESVILGKDTNSSKDPSEEMARTILRSLQDLARLHTENNLGTFDGTRLFRQDIDSYLSRSVKKSMSDEGIVIDGNIANDLARLPDKSKIKIGYVRIKELSYRAREVTVGLMLYNRSRQSSATSIELRLLENDFSRQANEDFIPTHSTYEISRMQSISILSSDQSSSRSKDLGLYPYDYRGTPTKAQRRLENPTDWENP